ncbi:MAG: hypothetical protein DME75_11860 [Verrucomicrobia bacterium]|nr:MAG: hypothetical protein DME75_11860 [Verrucomicrobiota bacterium]
MQDFAGAHGISVVNSLMIKRAVLVGLAFLALCIPLSAQQTNRTGEFDTAASLALYRPEIFSTVDSSVLIHDLPVLTLLDGQRLPVSSELGRMGMAPLNLPSLAYVSAANAWKVNAASGHRTDGKDFGTDGKDLSSEVTSSPLNPVYYGGEVGVFYGHSSGKFSGDDFGTYILGDAGNDKFHITVGASYEESSGHLPRFRSVEPSNR